MVAQTALVSFLYAYLCNCVICLIPILLCFFKASATFIDRADLKHGWLYAAKRSDLRVQMITWHSRDSVKSSQALLPRNDTRSCCNEPDIVRDVPEDAVGSPETPDLSGHRKLPELKQNVLARKLWGCLGPLLFVWPSYLRKHEKQEQSPWEVPFEHITELQWIGSGAQGAVFLGRWNNEDIAVKRVRSQQDTEIKHLKDLDHKNIVKFRYSITFLWFTASVLVAKMYIELQLDCRYRFAYTCRVYKCSLLRWHVRIVVF